MNKCTHLGKRSISGVVVNYNSGNYVSECIRAALLQAGEILLVDNASSDSGARDCARQFSDEGNFKIIFNKDNLVFAAACIIGFSQSKNDLILFLIPDCWLDDYVLCRLAQILFFYSAAGKVGGFLLKP